ncbi:murein L,D-transpeptidase catalytic domain family protein [Pedobacter sandarakinus]|uniref:murein L,D-transpeptidase catalytic domain family protein n=1 Tax=Pedobacter sandarakinus TaxID=353156 RepID=UPI002246AE35|nr:murein L,D-transpeptidase catalytic domain family protein [Pedobacter sandarakinus]MCX2574268.1 murein L,D-transpeptidase catalytic domain family protein [Pedobacter sandarakinus]
MRKYHFSFCLGALVLIIFTSTSWKPIDSRPQIQQELTPYVDSLYHNYMKDIYLTADLDSAGLGEDVFEKALTGFYNLKSMGTVNQKSILTIADFDQESAKKRLYIIDIDQKKLLLNTWVAHGQNSGGDKPNHFSNTINSNQSSLGFYLTGEIYYGKHGKSLKLDGMDAGFNNNARARAIVVHGADYVCQQTIDQLGRLGRSQGCPAVSSNLAEKVIATIAEKTVLFINKSEESYKSKFLNESLAAVEALSQQDILASQLD